MNGRYTLRYSKSEDPFSSTFAFSDFLTVSLADALFEKNTVGLNLFFTRSRDSWSNKTSYKPRYDLSLSGTYYTMNSSHTSYRTYDVLGSSVLNTTTRHTLGISVENLPTLTLSYSETSRKDSGARKFDYHHSDFSAGSEYRFRSVALQLRGFREKARSVFAPGASFELLGVDASASGSFVLREGVSFSGNYNLFSTGRKDYVGALTGTRSHDFSLGASVTPREGILLGASFAGRRVSSGPKGHMQSASDKNLNFSLSLAPFRRTRVEAARGYRFAGGSPGLGYGSLVLTHEQGVTRNLKVRGSANRSWYWQEKVLDRKIDSGALVFDVNIFPGVMASLSQAVSSTEPGKLAGYAAYRTYQTTGSLRATVTYRLSAGFDYQSGSSGARPSVWRPETRNVTARAEYLLTPKARYSVSLYRTTGLLTSYNFGSTLTYAMGPRSNLNLNYSRRTGGSFDVLGAGAYDSGSIQLSTTLRGDLDVRVGYEVSRLQDGRSYDRLTLEFNKRF